MAEGPLHDTIEKYLLGELSAQEQERLEAEMANDAALSDQVEIQRLALQGLQRLAAADLRTKFDQWDEDLDAPASLPDNPLPPYSSQNPWIWTTAALLLLLLAGAFWHFWQLGKVQQIRHSENAEIAQRDSVIADLRVEFQLFRDSLSMLLSLPRDSFSVLEIKRLREAVDRKDKALRALETQHRTGKPQIAMQFAPASNTNKRGGNTEDDPTLATAKKAYDTGDFATSANLLKSIPTNDPRYPQVKKRLPYSLFYAKDFEAAIPGFVVLLEEDTFGDPELPWYLTLCYVGTGQQMEARILLHNIMQNPNHKYFQKAIDLKKALKIQ